MPRSSGTYTLPAGNPVTTGTTITSTWANTTLSDIATALTGSVATDGTSPMTGILQMGNNRITGVANGTASTDVATVFQISNPTITGGTIDGAPIGAANPKNGAFLALSATSAALTGTCTAPTVTPGTDSSTKIATTAFVQSAISAVASGVTSFNTRSGAVTLSSSDVTTALGYTPYNSSGATVITTSNISTYAPTVSGTGAYGTWGISVSGNAATASTATTATTATTANALNTSNNYSTSGSISAGAFLYFGSTSQCNLFDNGGASGASLTAHGAQFTFGYSGSAYAVGTWISTSDTRIKENIETLDNSLNLINQLNPVKFSYTKDELADANHFGLLAQEVEQIIPQIVSNSHFVQGDITDIKAIAYTEIVPILIKAVQELSAKVDAQAAEIATLKGV